MKNTSIIIRESVVDDTDATAQVYVRAWQHAYQGILPQHFLQSLSIETRKKIRHVHLNNPDPKICHLIAITESKIVGFSDFGPLREGSDPYASELYALYVDPNFMRRGIGENLLERAENWLKKQEFTTMFVWTFEKNLSGRSFYEKHGFQFTNKIRQSEDHGVKFSEVLYQKAL